jgi:death on curing protein
MNPEWVAYEVVLAIHEAQIAEHGGLMGIRDQGLLESALARPQNLHAYSTTADVCDLAAAYAIGLAKNHAFIDGKKRTAWVVCATFLELNGRSVIAGQNAVVTMMLGVAGGTVIDEAFSAWLQETTSKT